VTVKRFGLLGRFAIASALAIVVLWAVLARVESDRVRARAIDEAAASTELLAQVVLQPTLSSGELQQGVDAETTAELDEAFRTGLQSGLIARTKVWTPEGEIVYSDDHALTGKVFPIADDLAEALEGEVEAEISELDEAENIDEQDFGTLLEVYVPIRFGADEPVEGVFELYVPYDAIAASIADDTRRISLLLLAGLILLWAVLFRIVAGASRRLRRDRAELARRADENRYLALHDQLTDLPNRMLFHDRLEQAVAAADREGTSVGVLILDLDRFKEVNDTLGHDGGDQILTEVGPRVRGVLRNVDTVARMGGDEFGILLGGVKRIEEVEPVARKIAQALDLPFRVDDIEVALGGSIGVALYPTHGSDPDILMRRAEIAMYVAKAARAKVET
jgi:diguanylate cyclase (GGDEF)-like protein